MQEALNHTAGTGVGFTTIFSVRLTRLQPAGGVCGADHDVGIELSWSDACLETCR
jgi:hypothetical protein